MVAQLTLALILLYLHSIRKMMQLDSYELRRSESSNHLPRHPIDPRHSGKNDAGDLGPKYPELLLRVSRSSNTGQSDNTMLRCPHTRKPNVTLGTDWQRQDYHSGTIHIYSAVYDSRTTAWRRPDSGTIRVLVLASGLLQGHATAVYCQVWFAEVSEPVVVRADLIELDADVGQLRIGHQVYVQYVISCLLHQPAATDVEAVSVVVRDRCGSASALVPVYHHTAATPETTGIGICAVLAWPVSAESSRVLPLQSAPWLVEWMELQFSVFGASRVFLYVAFDDDLRPLKRLIRLYVADDRKSLVVRRIPHPVAAGGKRRRREVIGNLRALAVNDCLLRGASQFRYLIDVDIDELVVPRHVAQNYSGMIARIASNAAEKRPQFYTPAIYFFRVLSFHVDAPTDDPQSSRLTTTGCFRSRDRPEKATRRAMIDSSRCVVVSPSTGCDVTAMADAAAPVKDSWVDVPLNVAGCHRYRRACAASPDVGCETASGHLPIKDNTMLRFQPRLKLSVIQALKDSGTLDKAGLYYVALNDV